MSIMLTDRFTIHTMKPFARVKDECCQRESVAKTNTNIQ